MLLFSTNEIKILDHIWIKIHYIATEVRNIWLVRIAKINVLAILA